MNLFEAENLFGFTHKEYNPESVKKRYKQLAIINHPDKGGNPEKMAKLNQAYSILLNNNNNTFDIIKSFMEIFKYVTVPIVKTLPVVNMSLKEYMGGAIKEITTNVECDCDLFMCNTCTGTGLNLNMLPAICMDCMGSGWYKNCKFCRYGNRIKKIKIEPFSKLENDKYIINLIMDENYIYHNNLIIYNKTITYKESISGFQKTFVDPLGNSHTINVNKSVTTGDAYFIKINNNKIFIRFVVISHILNDDQTQEHHPNQHTDP
jgi:DnaJ-class molecular chaperone